MTSTWAQLSPAVTFSGDSWGSVIGQFLLYFGLIALLAFAVERYRKSRDRNR